jgi:hypothetical protein
MLAAAALEGMELTLKTLGRVAMVDYMVAEVEEADAKELQMAF